MFRLSKWVFAGAVVFGFAFISLAEIPSRISFQGILKDSSGDVVPDGSYAVTFRIYDEATGGDALWDEEQQVNTVGGLFTIILGSEDPIPDTAFDGSTQYLSIQIEGESEMEARLPIESEAYSYRSAFADSAGSGAGGDTDWVIDGENIYRLDGNVGIGTASPTRKLHVAGESQFDDVVNIATSTGSEIVGKEGHFLNIASATGVILQTLNENASISFYTNNQARLLVDGGGNVGIGTSGPSTSLHLYRNASGTGATNGILIDQDGSGDASLSFRLLGSEQFVMGIDNSDGDKFKISDGANYGTDRLVIDATGNVGIGMESPTRKLDIVGDFRANGVWERSDDYIDLRPGNTGWGVVVRQGGDINDWVNIEATDTYGTIGYVSAEGPLYFTSSNVGIGTSTPGNPLHVVGPATTALFQSTATRGLIRFGDQETVNSPHIGSSGNDFVILTGPTSSEKLRVESGGYLSLKSSSTYSLARFNSGTTVYAPHIGASGDNLVVLAGPGTSEVFRINSDGNVGIGTTSPSAKLHVAGDILGNGNLRANTVNVGNTPSPDDKNPIMSVKNNAGSGIAGRSTTAGQFGIWGFNDNGVGIGCGTGDASSAAFSPIAYNNIASNIAIDCKGSVDVSGNMNIIGTLSKGGGVFKIDHPIDPANKYLYHSFVESPDMMNVYNGNVLLDENGEATVRLPDYFEALNIDFRYQLTCIGGYAPVYIADKIHDNVFRIAGGTDGLEISWQVTGIRQDPWADAHRIVSEVEKSPEERGKYLHAVEYGQPTSMAIR